jgi:hypothetical protein
MSLDIEGAELPVLKTVPWDKVTNKSFLSLNINILSYISGNVSR